MARPEIPSDQQPADPQWQYGGFLDAAYLLDFNHPSNHLFRSRGTAYKVDEPILNMAAAYLRKTASEASRWGMEFTLQGGQDSKIFGFSATASNLGGSEWSRHLGPTDVSYLAPVGKSLTVQAGIFSSLIGYDSLYAKDNFNYTRPWGADFTPYLMMGVNASYPLTNKLTGTVFVINGYWHLADANHVPSSGAQFGYKVTDHTTLKETVLFGPHQFLVGQHRRMEDRPHHDCIRISPWNRKSRRARESARSLDVRAAACALGLQQELERNGAA